MVMKTKLENSPLVVFCKYRLLAVGRIRVVTATTCYSSFVRSPRVSAKELSVPRLTRCEQSRHRCQARVTAFFCPLICAGQNGRRILFAAPAVFNCRA